MASITRKLTKIGAFILSLSQLAQSAVCFFTPKKENNLLYEDKKPTAVALQFSCVYCGGEFEL
jgi:hypothetical protein